jgi:hypothetical protein
MGAGVRVGWLSLIGAFERVFFRSGVALLRSVA